MSKLKCIVMLFDAGIRQAATEGTGRSLSVKWLLMVSLADFTWAFK